jgi:hypothetical protein
MSKFLNSDDLKSIEYNFVESNSMRLIIEKNCGYRFSVLLPENGTINDLYRYVELYYSHMNEPLNLYYSENYVRNCPPNNEDNVNANDIPVNEVNSSNNTDVSNDKKENKQEKGRELCNKCRSQRGQFSAGKKVFIKKDSVTIKSFINSKKIMPCTELPNKVYYKLYLDICKEHN